MRRVAFGTTLALVLLPHTGSAQAIQALRARAVSQDSIDRLVDSITARVSRHLAAYDRLAAMSEAGTDSESRAGARACLPVATTIRQLARDVLSEVGSPELVLRHYNAFQSYAAAIPRDGGSGPLCRPQAGNAAPVEELAAPPVLHRIPAVSFVVGTTATLGPTVVFQAEVGTNLLGAAVGGAFDAIGSDRLKEYLQDNLALGAALPYGGGARLTRTLGIGLGGIRLGRWNLWPAINVEQAGRSDTRVPPDVVASDAQATSWTTPSFNVAVSPWTLEAIAARSRAGEVTPIFTLGLRFPYYYPGDSFQAVAALFSGARADYRLSGKVQFQVGVWIPLQAVQAPGKRGLL